MAASTNSPVPSSRALAKARAKALRDRKQGCCSPRRSSAGRGGGGFLATLINFTFKIGIFYVIIGALWHCSSKPFSFEYSANDPRALCRNLYTVKAELTPHLHDLHAQLSPHVEPYIAPLRPYAQQAYKRGKPIYNDLTKRGALAWKRYGEPKRQQAEKAARKWADPHIKRARKEWKKQVQPHIDHAHKTTKPYQDTYMRDVHPHVLNAYAFSSDVSTRASGFYLAHVQPNLIKATKQSYAFYKAHILPYLRRAFSLYVRPAVDKALAKVFQRQVGEARKEAVKEAKKDADLAREAAAQEAASKSASKIASVIRAQESPTYMEQAKQAVFGKDDPEEALRIARLDAELDTEQAAIRSDLAAWENQHVKLVQQQYRLTLQRVADLRNRALVDLPDRFALLSADVVQGEVQSVLSRLEREFEKLSSEEDERSTAEKVAVFDALVEREIEALRDAKKAKDTDLDNFFVALATEEIDTADAAIKELDLFTVDAKRAYDELMEKAKFEATVEEFVSWDDELVLRSLMLRQELLEVFKGERKPNLAFGAVDLSAEPKIDAEVGKLKKQTDTVFDAAVSEIRSYGNSALLQLRGEGVRRQIQAVSGSIAESASAISSDISAGLSDAIHAAKVKLSLEDDPSLLSSLSKSASSAASAASSAAAALTSDVSDRASAADKKARAAASSAAQAARSGVRSAASAAGASVTPETPREYAESVAADLSSAAGQATDAVKDAGASASSLLHKATRSVASAVGASVTPETREEYVEAAQASASSVAQAARSSVAAGAEAVQSSVAAGAEAVQSSVAAGAEAVQSSVAAGVEAVQSGVAAGAEAVQSGAASAYADASAGASAAFAQASSLLHQATRSAASAAGASVTPESLGDYLKVIQDQAESINDAIRSAGADAVDAAGSGIHHATRSIASAVGATPSPESASEYAEYASKKAGDAYASAASFVGGAASQLSERAAAAGSDAASLLHQATRSASSAVGATPTPERAGEYVESIVGQAQSAYEGAAGYVSDAYEGAASYVSDAADAAYSVVATDASSVLHQATRSAASAAGYKPSPEGIREHFESATSKAAEAAQSVASRLHDEL
ncbi:hypothetical protein OC844_005485 [Tilletia horrida]|nr:hypothetical protein OC844_005485 [Tilletia horrida]